jgi:hypothetical protein
MARKIKEQLDYGNRPERMDPNLERKLASPENLYAQNPAMKKGTEDVQRLISNRFQKVAEKLSQVTGIENLSSQQTQGMVYQEMMRKLPSIMRIEAQHREELEQLAIEASLEETEVPADWFVIEAMLNREPINTGDFRMKPEDEEEEEEDENETPEIPSFDIEDLTDEEVLELEKHKRNIINAIVQGAAKKGHYIFQKPDIKARLDAINPSLYGDYLGIMSINDFLYFTMEQMIEMMSQTGQGVAGKVKLQDNDDEDGEEGGEDEDKPDTKIVAQGMIFPILCHEIIKGIEEGKGRYGLPTDMGLRKKVQGQVDILSNEPMQLRIGPEIVERIRFALPDGMYEESNQGLIPWFHILLYQIPAEEFLKVIGYAISEDESKIKMATKRFVEIMKEAQKMKSDFDNFREDGDSDDSNLNPGGGFSSYDDDEDSDVDYAPEEEDDDEDYLDDMDSYLDSLGIKRPDNLDDLLGDLGISRPK